MTNKIEEITKLKAELLILFAVFCMGMTFPLIRMALVHLDPNYFVSLRFALAAILIMLLFRGWNKLSLPCIYYGALLGATIWVGYITQTIGLETISSARAAFITSTAVIMVPLLAPLFGRSLPSKEDWMAVLIAILGLYFLLDPDGIGISTADLWVFLCAFATAVYILLLDQISRLGYGDAQLALIQVLTIALCSAMFLPWSPLPKNIWLLEVIIPIIYCALFATALVFYIATRYQKHTTPTRVAIIYSMEPVFALALGYVILNETLSLQALFGAILLLSSLLIVPILQIKKQ